jgi:orotate phosphoribosyltransferase
MFEIVLNTLRTNLKPDVIAGVATGAIGIGILVAESLGVPFVYVRPEAKNTGVKTK